MTGWQVLERDEVPVGLATISEGAWPSLALPANGYVKIKANGRTRCFAASKREAAQGTMVFVGSKTFGSPSGAVDAVVEAVSARGVRANLVFGTGNGRASLVGLTFAIAGTIVQAVNATHAHPSTALAAIAGTVQIMGLLVVFFRGVWNLSPS